MGGEGGRADVSLNLFFLCSWGMSEDAAVGSGTLTRPVPRLSLIH